MRKSNRTPRSDQNVYPRWWRSGKARPDLARGRYRGDGQYRNPVSVISFNIAEKWAQDVSADVTQEVRRRCDLQLRAVLSQDYGRQAGG